MDWSTRRKMGCFGMIGIVVLLISSYFVYIFFIKKTPTCFDGVRNQNERGIDCGGICSVVCTQDAKSLIPLWTRVFHITDDVYSVVAYLENQNTTAAIQKISYEIRIYDDKNILTSAPITGSTFISPQSKMAIFASPLKTGKRIPQRAFITFTTSPQWMTPQKKYQTPFLAVNETQLSDESSSPKLSARISNPTYYSLHDVEVTALLYDASGNAVHASQSFIENLEQQSSAQVYFTWPEPFLEKITRIEIIPRFNPFDQK